MKSILSCCICSPCWNFRNIALFLPPHRAQSSVESPVAQGSNGSDARTKQPLYSACRKFNWCLSGCFPFFMGTLLRHYNWLSQGDKWQLWIGGGKIGGGNLSTFYLSIERSMSAKKHLKEIFCSYLARTRTHGNIFSWQKKPATRLHVPRAFCNPSWGAACSGLDHCSGRWPERTSSNFWGSTSCMHRFIVTNIHLFWGLCPHVQLHWFPWSQKHTGLFPTSPLAPQTGLHGLGKFDLI